MADEPRNQNEEIEQNEQSEQDNLPAIDVNVEDAGTLKKKVTVTVPRERIDAKTNEMFGELSQSAQIPGFRVGHAPRRLIEKRFGREVGQDVRNALVGESLGQAIEQAKLTTLGEPDLDLDKIELPDEGELTYSFEVEVAPEFELPKLEGIEVNKPKIEITDQRVDEQLDQWRQGMARFEASEEAASEGDVVTADATITGPDIEHKSSDLTLRVAPGQVEGIALVDLGKALSGKKAGENASLSVKVPEGHPNEQWREKEVSVELTISAVRRRVLPEMTDEFAQQAGFTDLAELKDYVRQNLQQRVQAETQRAMREQVVKYLLDNTKLDVPEGVAARHTARALQRRYVELLQMGFPREKIDENLTTLQAAAKEQAQRDLKVSFIVGKIADQQNIEVSDAEVNATIAAMAQQYNRRPERLRQELAADGSLQQVSDSLREDKAIDKLLEQAKVNEVDPLAQTEEKAEKPKKSSKKKAEKEE